MEESTLKALKASIAKWERNAVAETREAALIYTESCPLCHLFVRRTGECYGCPVEEKTGSQECNGSPWEDAWLARTKWVDGEVGGMERFHAAARAEVDFLKSLLPPEETA